MGRGYLPGVAVMFLTVLTAQVVAVLGYGAWFPWSVPSLVAGAAGPDQPSRAGPDSRSSSSWPWPAVLPPRHNWERADHAA